ncbi:killer cell lectin-like receptor subfamily G member 1 [Erpetoichthys calabaricus]|uniref:killer cell lectin-like receptor subfamily G member 1 n=1 Tax=Erpetoichthys calabaricus TaxID=27687 RepID=UPI002234188A|nr:killer cell lectin-like receptor subfamily G member 1 [Erpetoichthys calabaricus]
MNAINLPYIGKRRVLRSHFNPEVTYSQVEWDQRRGQQRSQQEGPALTDHQNNKGSGHKNFILRCRFVALLTLIMLGLAIAVVYLFVIRNKSDAETQDEVTSKTSDPEGSHITFMTLGGHSYYFSNEKNAWRSSMELCARHQSILAVFKDKAEMVKSSHDVSLMSW